MKNKNIAVSIYALIVASLILLNAGMLLAPVFALVGNDAAAAFLYNTYSVQGHQWIYRSLCVFEGEGGISVGECIPKGKEADSKVYTKFTNSAKNWDGQFEYGREQIARNRAEVVQRDGMIGYKIGACARNTAIYLGLLIGALALPFVRKIEDVKWPPRWILIAAMVPVGIDGTGQMMGLWESTDLSRIITGAIVGIAMPFYLIPIGIEIFQSIFPGKKGGKK